MLLLGSPLCLRQAIANALAEPAPQYPYPNKETRTRCLDRLRETNRQLELFDISSRLQAEFNQITPSYGTSIIAPTVIVL